MGDELIEYWFGDGATVTRWTSPAEQGAVLLDFDGDGRVDDAMVDLDGDGRADVAALDLDDDGTRETAFRDDGSGRWAQSTDPPASGPTPVPGRPGGAGATVGGLERAASSTCPIPGVARAPEPVDTLAAVSAVPAEPGQPARQAVVDTDADGAPDVLLFDTDGDGTADGAVPLDDGPR